MTVTGSAKADIYCPWDGINHVARLSQSCDAEPEAYWINTSNNSLVKRFIDKADRTTQGEIEELVRGETITKTLNLELTYNEIENSIDNLWSVLYMTGYLTGRRKGIDEYALYIPNKEVEYVFKFQIQKWFNSTLSKNADDLLLLWKAIEEGESETVERIITKFLSTTISVLDPKGDEKEKEKFYHSFVSGLISRNGNWRVLSNREKGDGYPDLTIEPEDPERGMVIELKTSLTFPGLESRAEEAIEQIKRKNYTIGLISEGRKKYNHMGNFLLQEEVLCEERRFHASIVSLYKTALTIENKKNKVGITDRCHARQKLRDLQRGRGACLSS